MCIVITSDVVKWFLAQVVLAAVTTTHFTDFSCIEFFSFQWYHITNTRLIIWRSFPLQITVSNLYVSPLLVGWATLCNTVLSGWEIFYKLFLLQWYTRLYIPYRHHHRLFQVWTLMLTCQPAFFTHQHIYTCYLDSAAHPNIQTFTLYFR